MEHSQYSMYLSSQDNSSHQLLLLQSLAALTDKQHIRITSISKKSTSRVMHCYSSFPSKTHTSNDETEICDIIMKALSNIKLTFICSILSITSHL